MRLSRAMQDCPSIHPLMLLTLVVYRIRSCFKGRPFSVFSTALERNRHSIWEVPEAVLQIINDDLLLAYGANPTTIHMYPIRECDFVVLTGRLYQKKISLLHPRGRKISSPRCHSAT